MSNVFSYQDIWLYGNFLLPLLGETLKHMNMKKFIEVNMLFTNKKIFGDNEEHEYEVFCRDGHAIAIPSIGELITNPEAPRLLELTYPTMDELNMEEKIECLEFLGIYNQSASICNAADVCMKHGKLQIIKK